MLPAAPGDVLAVWTSNAWFNDLIRFGYALRGKTSVANHVALITHQDVHGRWIGIQGQPGGVGLVDVTHWLSDSRTRSNHAQPKPNTKGELTAYLAACAKAIGIRYDWVGIGEDALADLDVPDLSAEVNRLWEHQVADGHLPGEVVCSSLAAAVYCLPQVDWAHPDLGTERLCQPGDWWNWSDQHAWTQE